MRRFFRMSRAAATQAALFFTVALLFPSFAHGHPMGNISISHYAGIEIGESEITVKFLLDYAEIPSVRELERVDPDRDDRVTPEEREAYLAELTDRVLANLHLAINGQPLTLTAAWNHVAFPPGEGGLSTVRVAWELNARVDSSALRETNLLLWNDSNYESHVGWKEIRIEGNDGIFVGRTSLREQPKSGELSDYPEEFLYNPPEDTKAWCHFGTNEEVLASSAIDVPEGFGGKSSKDPFVELISGDDLSAKAILWSLLLAIFLGAGHALEPGHGKAVVAAYLIGSKGTVRQAAFLGLTVTITHTLSVFLLGIAVLLLSQTIMPETLFPWLGLVSGVLIVLVGLGMLWTRARTLSGSPSHHHHHHDHEEHDHDHHHHGPGHSHHHHGPGGHTHSHLPPDKPTWKNLLALGISGGLVPCPAGIVVLLAAVALGRIGFGLLLIVAFSVGLAAVLMGVGILFVTARRTFDRLPFGNRFGSALGVASAIVVTVFGIILTWQSLGETIL